jgi:hypothetical protein
MQSPKHRWIHLLVLIAAVPAIVVLGSISIRIFDFPWTGPLLMTAWFGYLIWFLWVHRTLWRIPFRKEASKEDP